MRVLNFIRHGLQSSSFVAATAKLVMGTAAGHAITLAVLPLLSRLYSPADFGALAVLSGAVGLFSAAACARFDIAIPLPAEDREASALLVLSLLCALVLALLLAVIVGSWPRHLADWVGQPGLARVWWFFPLGLFCTGSALALQNWFVRKKQFAELARNRVYQAGAAGGGQVGLGFAGFTPVGLLLGPVLNAGVACLVLGARVWRGERKLLAAVDWPVLRATARRYRQFPRFSAAEALFNSAAIQAPILFLAGHASAAEVGCVALAMSVLQVPMALIGAAIGQVFFSQAAAEFRAGSLRPFTRQVLVLLLKSGGVPIIAAGLLAPMAVPLVFGAEWSRAGVLVGWMTPWFLLQFLVSPISFALHVTGRLGAAMALQVACLVIRFGAVYFAANYQPQLMAEAYALSGAVAYGFYLLVVLRVVKEDTGPVRSGEAAVA
jgi:O-antigen/teichoic acid export membrane protein